MTICRLSVLVGLAVLVAVTGVEAAVILATAPFPSTTVNTGTVYCAVTNTGTTSTAVSAVMYDGIVGGVLATMPSQPLVANATLRTDGAQHPQLSMRSSLRQRSQRHGHLGAVEREPSFTP